MYLTHLSLTDYRNFTRLSLDVPRGMLLLVGANAQGKTSLLEAVYFLATFSAFDAESDRQAINFIAGRNDLAVGRIVADFQRGGKKHRLEVRLIQDRAATPYENGVRLRKEILLDNVKRKNGEAFGQFNAVLFLPQMLRIVDGTPEERRRYLNMALAQIIPAYADHLSAYARSVAQRNALLKQLAERGGDPNQLAFWDEQLAEHGSALIYARIHAIQTLERLAALNHHELTRRAEVLRLIYQPAYDPLPLPKHQTVLPLNLAVDRAGLPQEKIQRGFLQALAAHRNQDIARGVTTLGPHRDELRFLANGVDLGSYGSRGQIRTAMLALKLAEVEWMQQTTGESPVLLLDEVLAELDADRRHDLLQRLGSSEQAFLTTTDLDLFSPSFVSRASIWQVHAGIIQPRLVEATE